MGLHKLLQILSIFVSLFVAIESSAFSYTSLANKYNVPSSLLRAIQEAESGNNPYAIHLQSLVANSKSVETLLKYHSIQYGKSTSAEKVHFSVNAKSFREAEYVLNYVTKYCTKWDIGLFQISDYWVRTKQINQIHLLFPEYNADWGAKILSGCFQQERGNIWLATECYNRGSSKGRLSGYSQRVYRYHLKQYSKPTA